MPGVETTGHPLQTPTAYGSGTQKINFRHPYIAPRKYFALFLVPTFRSIPLPNEIVETFIEYLNLGTNHREGIDHADGDRWLFLDVLKQCPIYSKWDFHSGPIGPGLFSSLPLSVASTPAISAIC